MPKLPSLLATVVASLLAGYPGGQPAAAQASKTVAGGTTPQSGSRACPPHRGGNILRPGARDATPAEKARLLEMFHKSPTGRTFVAQFSISMSQAAAKRRDTTLQSYDPQHGNQVSFDTADGRSYLWYPGNTVVLKGEWRACEDRFGVTVKGAGTTTLPFGKVCFKYGPNTYNPVTGTRGDEWECAAAARLETTLTGQRPGDVFGLAKRVAVPFVLPREKMTMDQLLARKKN